MYKSYLKTAFRGMIRHKGTSAIKIIGLSVSLAATLLLLLFIRHELSFDEFHKNKNRIYRVISNLDTPYWFIDSFYGNPNLETLISIFEQLPQGLSELVTHPGYICDNSHNLDYSLQREMELEVLKSDTLRQILEEMQITLVGYSQIKALKTEN